MFLPDLPASSLAPYKPFINHSCSSSNLKLGRVTSINFVCLALILFQALEVHILSVFSIGMFHLVAISRRACFTFAHTSSHKSCNLDHGSLTNSGKVGASLGGSDDWVTLQVHDRVLNTAGILSLMGLGRRKVLHIGIMRLRFVAGTELEPPELEP